LLLHSEDTIETISEKRMNEIGWYRERTASRL